ncbi:flippase-like domain-containing protein [Luteibacter aegosomaticola]|uniref:lysylphosphatidylglycerol synthase domain-containing protein n=1 Tax=Luteibacter aegosomaticola TaxID=2911538 RepID=UPI001FF88AE9|nr:lysylphosphatidylglycerol synthase domain-containing protein [Luteibacter aegosomaticola]UPG91121.1 flippase-like domain-containing protein [Luteibacter aegosomaticola]
MSTTRTVWIRRLLGWLVATVAIVFFVQRAVSNAAHIPHIRWDAAAGATATATVILPLIVVYLSAVIWQLLLRDQGIVRRNRDVFALFTVSQFGKYLPGNVGQFIGRVVMARDIGIAIPATLATMLTEVLWNVGTGLGLSALAIYLFVGNKLTAFPPWLDTAGLGLGFLALLAAPWIGITLLRRVFPGLVARVFASSELRPPGWGTAIRVSSLYLANYLCMGMALSLQAKVFYGAPDIPLLEASGFCAMAWLAGYLLPGAPAGLGVREGLMLVLFSPMYGESTAIALGITLRLGAIAADVIAFALGWLARARGRARNTSKTRGTHDAT